MGNKFLDKQGLATFLAQSKELFATDTAVTEVKTTTDSYVLNVDYTPLKFDTSEIVSGGNAGGGGAECSGNHIIEVTELPTENINEDALYKVMHSGLINVLYGGFPISQLITEAPFTYHYAETKPVENIAVSSETNGFHVYYIVDENGLFLYIDAEGTGEYSWMSFSELMGAPFNGAISDESEATEEALYALVGEYGDYYQHIEKTLVDIFANGSWNLYEGHVYRYAETRPTENLISGVIYYIEDENIITFCIGSGWWDLFTDVSAIAERSEAIVETETYALVQEWKHFIVPSKGTTIVKNDIMDVTDYSIIKIDVPNAAVCGIWRFNEWLDDPVTDIEQDVNFTTIFEDGKEVECVNMHFGGSGPLSDPYYTYFTTAEGSTKTVWENTADDWNYDSARTVNFGAEPQIVTSIFKNFLTANAVQQEQEYIIEVDTLPTENISGTDIYMVKGATVCVDMAGGDGATVTSYKGLYDALGVFFTIYNVDELPTTDIRISINNVQVYVYYIKSTNTLHQYKDGSWISLTDKGYTPIMGSADEYYKYVKEFKDLILLTDTGATSFNVTMIQEGGSVECFYVDNYENVTDPQPFDQANMHIPLYYDESRDDVFIYIDGAWVSFGDMEGTTNGGAITDKSEATLSEHHYALVSKSGWKRAEWTSI